jgi:hypothetical protein
MNDSPALALSPSFERARTLSRIIAILFTLGLLVMLTVALSAVVFVFFPKTPSGVGFGIGLPNGFGAGFGAIHGWPAVGTMVAVELMTVPTVLVLHHMRKLFFCFAQGEVFAARPIAHIRRAGLWMTMSFFTGIAGVFLLALCGHRQGLPGVIHFPNAIPAIALRFEGAIFTGIPILIAAYVMAEARRIADENASIL